MRAKPSSIASGMYSRSGSFTTPIPIYAVTHLPGSAPTRGEIYPRPEQQPLPSNPNALRHDGQSNDGLLHDARNLMGAIGLYCDLLSMPGVLHDEHRQYADELRLLGARSGALIERLLQSVLTPPSNAHPSDAQQSTPAGSVTTSSVSSTGADRSDEALRALAPLLDINHLQDGAAALPSDQVSTTNSTPQPAPVSLRKIVERCAGLLSRVAGGRVIELNYGEAATVPVAVEEEAIERILVNLVRNAASALRVADQRAADQSAADPSDQTESSGPSNDPHSDSSAADRYRATGLGAVLHRTPDPTADEIPGTIRIGVGFVVDRANDPKPWPIRRVRLTVEDSGCGMTQQQLERILYGDRAPSRGSHGIGFRVVRELVASSGGDLGVMSACGSGTRVQIEWPVGRDRPAVSASGQHTRLSRLRQTDASSAANSERRSLSTVSHTPSSSTAPSISRRQNAVALSDSHADFDTN